MPEPESIVGLPRGDYQPRRRPPKDQLPADTGRIRCLKCFRPEGHCYCQVLPSIENRTDVTILQHPRERFHPFGTARILELSLAKIRILVNHVGHLNTQDSLGFRPRAALLYPSPDAHPIESLAPEQLPDELVILDGTWHHAHTMHRDIQALAALPRLSFTPNAPSRYRIRREPRFECVSTLEALVYALSQLEPETQHLQHLLGAFDRIIDEQLASQKQGPCLGRSKRSRQRALRKIPRAVVEQPTNLVVAYGESVRASRSIHRKKRLPVYFTAMDLRTGACFAETIQPSHPLGDAHLGHMQLERSDFDGALSLEEFRLRWQSFLKPGRVVAAYNKSTLDLLEAAATPPPAGAIALKGAYFNLGRASGSLDDIVVAEGLKSTRPPVGGRAQTRLGNAIALTHWLSHYPTEHPEPPGNS